jgi:hypothetical protein
MWRRAVDRGRCGRPIRKTGTPCARQKDEYLPEACYSHLTREERTERDRLAAAAHVEREAKYAALEPNCWLWVVPTDEELQELFLTKFGGEAEVARFGLTDFLQRRESLAYFHFEDWHDRRCALCGIHPTPLVLDHDHRTGRIRGYLCRSCNLREGLYTGETVGPHARYRERNPATMLGISMTYTDGWGRKIIDPPARDRRGEDNALYGIGM